MIIPTILDAGGIDAFFTSPHASKVFSSLACAAGWYQF